MDVRAKQYRSLVLQRKACRACSDLGLVNAAEIQCGKYDSEQIGPGSQSFCDLRARVMVIGQDWGDQRAFEKQQGVNLANSATNRMLRTLMEAAGIAVSETADGQASGVFLTNAVLCFRKSGGCQGPVQAQWFENCATKFLRLQIDLIRPEIVICLGQRAYGAVRATYQLPPVPNWRAAVEGAGIPLESGPVLHAVYHCSQVVLNNHRNAIQQHQDWKRIGEAMAKL